MDGASLPQPTARGPRWPERVAYAAINLDYCGVCQGTCPACALSRQERATSRPLLSLGHALTALRTLADRMPAAEEFVLGVGRGNVLQLDPAQTDEGLRALASAACEQFDFHRGVMEIATSLIGRHEAHLERARRLRQVLDGSGFDPRFVVVVNGALQGNPRYWRNVRLFVEQLHEDRGGRDGAGDILQLNLTAGALPDLEALGQLLQGYGFPVNVTWVPVHDPAAAEPDKVAALGQWLADFHGLAERLGLDSTVRTYGHQAQAWAGATVAEALEQLAGYDQVAAFVDRHGQAHGAALTLLGDVDPVRNTPTAGGSVIVPAAQEQATLTRSRACRACPAAAACLATGAWITARTLYLRAPARLREAACPIGVQTLFERLLAAKRPGVSG